MVCLTKQGCGGRQRGSGGEPAGLRRLILDRNPQICLHKDQIKATDRKVAHARPRARSLACQYCQLKRCPAYEHGDLGC